jgi:hypothetical protein
VADRPRMAPGRLFHVFGAPKLCTKGVVVELKREIVEGKGGKEGKGYSMLGLHSIPTFILHFIFLLSCSLHLPKASKVKQNPLILFQSYFLKFLDFILCNDEINMMWKRSK